MQDGNGTLVVVEDDHHISDLVAMYLRREGFRVLQADDGERGLELVAESAARLVIVDVGLPGQIDGFEVCRRLRRVGNVPVIMLTARDDEVDRVLGLELGADDYVPKPFSARELLARMRAVLRRARPSASHGAGRDRLEVGDLAVDVPAHKATLAGKELQLTAFEFRVLVALARRAGETVTREELAHAVLPKGGRYDPSVDRSLDVHVSHLRHKLGDDVREPRRIRTVRGIGYVLLRSSS